MVHARGDSVSKKTDKNTDSTNVLTLQHNHSGDYCPACDAERKAAQEELRLWNLRRERAAKIEQAQSAHEVCTPPAAIAAQLNLDEKTVRFIIQRNRFPQSQLFDDEVTK